MKDIKTFLIGFLTCCCLFLIMGQTKADNDDYEMEMNVSGGTIKIGNEYGRYQAIPANKYESFYLLDTGTGTVYTQIENPTKNTYKKRLADVWSKSPYVHAFSKP